MFKSRPRQPAHSLSRSIQMEVLSLRHADQLDRLGMSKHLQRDIGIDCGCLDRPGAINCR